MADEVLEDRGIDPEQKLSRVPKSGQPTGEPFDEDDDEWFAATFPRLWARVSAGDEFPGGREDEDRISQVDVVHVVESGRKSEELAVTGPIAPVLAAHLFERGHIRHDERPMLAAHWLAEGKDGEALLELASLHGHEPEVSDLWPLALAELGVLLPGDDPRVAMAWAAQRVLAGEQDARWLVQTMWVTFEEVERQDDFQRLILLLDEILDWTDRDLGSRKPEEQDRATAARAVVAPAIEAMARDDLTGALQILAGDA